MSFENIFDMCKNLTDSAFITRFVLKRAHVSRRRYNACNGIAFEDAATTPRRMDIIASIITRAQPRFLQTDESANAPVIYNAHTLRRDHAYKHI